MSAKPLLIELFTEELPPKALKRLGDSFCASVLEGLRSRGLAAESSGRAGWPFASTPSCTRRPTAKSNSRVRR